MAKKPLPTPPSPPSEGSSSSDEELPPGTKPTPKPVPQTPTKNKEEGDSDDESESESDEESGDDEDEGEEKDDSKKPHPSALTPSTKPASESGGSGSESEDDESDSDSEAAKLVTPISSKPMAEVPVEKKKANGKAVKAEGDSDDESEGESEEESSDDEDEGKEKDDSKKPQPSASTPSTKPASGGSGSESEDDGSDSDSEAAKLVTPISSKPMAEVPVEKEKANGKASAFQRIWTLEDEIAILRGLVRFQSEKGPVKLNINSIRDFYDIIKKRLSLEVSSSQLVEKLRRLKKKYLKIAARVGGGKPPQFTHDEAVYELGKKIWAEEDESDGRVSNGVVANDGGGSLKEKVGSLKDKFPFLKWTVESMGKRYAEEALEMLEITKADALDKKLKKQKMVEMKHSVQKAELWKETLKLVTEGMERATS